MLPGPVMIRRCMECEGLIQQDSLLSGNTFGATFWTDGKMEASMMPDLPRIVKCPYCAALLWIDEQELVAEFEISDKQLDDYPSQRYEFLSFEDYSLIMNQLNLESLDLEKERYIRIRFWWSVNDKRRYSDRKNPLSQQEIENLKRLFELLDRSETSHRLQQVEILRELGQFDEAKNILDNEIRTDDYPEFIAVLDKLIRDRNPFVSKIEYAA